ncbi:unnamed protein product [Mytilus coruscus]|uniref:TIR domain-containing protein n=1 Tax=Mytilus coruscus TaxID=42192 RepID=A0A6J8CUB2_MYTCO|nr:unnamed protein product [Mytilus coruscus]
MAEDQVSLMRDSQYDIELRRKGSFDESLAEHSYRFGTKFYDTITYSESLDFDISLSAPDLHELYRYHVFFSHCNEDKSWVCSIMNKLESEPYNYKCSYGDFQNANKLSFFQSALCSAMLSERVVVVLTPNYVKTAWKEFREILQNLTEKSLYRQRMLVVLLKDCMIPEPLQQLGFLDARESDFFPCFVRYVGSDRLPRSSDSFASEMTCILYSPSNYVNGQILTTVGLHIRGHWKGTIICNEENNIPTPLCCHGVNVRYGEYMEVIQTLCQVIDRDLIFEFMFSLRPIIILVFAGVIWLVVFLFVMAYVRDEPRQSALGIRLIVFTIPLLFVLYGYGLRWKRQLLHKKICRRMMRCCIDLNGKFYRAEKPVLLTIVVCKDGSFNIQFVYYCIDDCTIDLELLLNTYNEEDAEKFNSLIELYTKSGDFLSEKTLGEQLLVMIAAVFLHCMILKQLPSSTQERHTNQNMCLCQFVEMVMAEYFQCLSKLTIVPDLQDVLQKRLFLSVEKKKLKERKRSLAINEEFSFVSI